MSLINLLLHEACWRFLQMSYCWRLEIGSNLIKLRSGTISPRFFLWGIISMSRTRWLELTTVYKGNSSYSWRILSNLATEEVADKIWVFHSFLRWLFTNTTCQNASQNDPPGNLHIPYQRYIWRMHSFSPAKTLRYVSSRVYKSLFFKKPSHPPKKR